METYGLSTEICRLIPPEFLVSSKYLSLIVKPKSICSS
jgi:hypothetical protein